MSTRFPSKVKQLFILRQDESCFKQFSFLKRCGAIDVNGTFKNVKGDELTLVRFFDVGIKKEVHWNDNQIALQVEDVYGFISVKFINNFVDKDNEENIDLAIIMVNLQRRASSIAGVAEEVLSKFRYEKKSEGRICLKMV